VTPFTRLETNEGTMKLCENEEGQVLVLTVLCSTILLGFIGLALDVGLLFRAKRNLQIAADSAATAAALDYYYNSSSGAIAVTEADTVGVGAASIDNVKIVNGTTVDVHCPAQNGSFALSAGSVCNGYFEAIIRQPNPTIFMRIFNRNVITVSARSVAGTPYISNTCVYVTQSGTSAKVEMEMVLAKETLLPSSSVTSQ
jgi:uncharacterized membrane protein